MKGILGDIFSHSVFVKCLLGDIFFTFSFCERSLKRHFSHLVFVKGVLNNSPLQACTPSPPVEKRACFNPMVSHPPPPRDHPDEDIRQGVLGVLAQPAKPVQEALRERGAYLMLLVPRQFYE